MGWDGRKERREGKGGRKGSLAVKLVNGSRVGQVGPVDSCGQVEDLDPSLVNLGNLSRVGQVRNIKPSGSN